MPVILQPNNESKIFPKILSVCTLKMIIMEGSYKAHNLQKNSKRTNNKDKQIASVNPEKPDKKDEFLVAF